MNNLCLLCVISVHLQPSSVIFASSPSTSSISFPFLRMLPHFLVSPVSDSSSSGSSAAFATVCFCYYPLYFGIPLLCVLVYHSRSMNQEVPVLQGETCFLSASHRELCSTSSHVGTLLQIVCVLLLNEETPPILRFEKSLSQGMLPEWCCRLQINHAVRKLFSPAMTVCTSEPSVSCKCPTTICNIRQWIVHLLFEVQSGK